MAVIDGHLALATLLAALAGGLDKPKSNWTEIGIRLPAPQQSIQVLDQRGNFGDSATPSSRKKITPPDFFRIVELAPKAILAPDALKEIPAGADTLLHIKASDGRDYHFVGEQERFKDRSAQEIWNILRHYRN
ncbi:MAG: hypothetical protein A2063_00810 [Gallionellales bacterium GWA2_60_142]|jgi:hypothetical protein|nr:MAG: hypothetical protein A2063_00810 [Gallionellales bacterium GWA2_60_142]